MDGPDQRVGKTRNTIFQMHQMQPHLPREQLSAPLIGGEIIEQRKEKPRKSRKSEEKHRAPEKEETSKKGEEELGRMGEEKVVNAGWISLSNSGKSLPIRVLNQLFFVPLRDLDSALKGDRNRADVKQWVKQRKEE